MIIISFMERFKASLMNGTKNRTNRAYSKYRNRTKIGDRVQIYIKQRSPEGEKLFEAIITNKIIWNINQAPHNIKKVWEISPLKNEIWLEFAKRDGFKQYSDFLEYFDPENHPKKQSKYICFEFEKIQNYFKMNYSNLDIWR